jgi:hypothetical protein
MNVPDFPRAGLCEGCVDRSEGDGESQQITERRRLLVRARAQAESPRGLRTRSSATEHERVAGCREPGAEGGAKAPAPMIPILTDRVPAVRQWTSTGRG